MNLVVKGGSWKGAAWTDREGVREGKMLLLLSSSALHLAFYSPFGCKFRCLAKLLRLSLPPAESPRGAEPAAAVFQDFLGAAKSRASGSRQLAAPGVVTN